jgi:hypothetical protein
MKIILTLINLFLVVTVSAQQSFRIQHISKVFHGSIASTLDKKINDSLIFHIVNKGENYEISILRLDGTSVCSCLYKLNVKSETLQTRTMLQNEKGIMIKDSAEQIKVFEPLNDNCIERYQMLIVKGTQ